MFYSADTWGRSGCRGCMGLGGDWFFLPPAQILCLGCLETKMGLPRKRLTKFRPAWDRVQALHVSNFGPWGKQWLYLPKPESYPPSLKQPLWGGPVQWLMVSGQMVLGLPTQRDRCPPHTGRETCPNRNRKKAPLPTAPGTCSFVSSSWNLTVSTYWISVNFKGWKTAICIKTSVFSSFFSLTSSVILLPFWLCHPFAVNSKVTHYSKEWFVFTEILYSKVTKRISYPRTVKVFKNDIVPSFTLMWEGSKCPLGNSWSWNLWWLSQCKEEHSSCLCLPNQELLGVWKPDKGTSTS